MNTASMTRRIIRSSFWTRADDIKAAIERLGLSGPRPTLVLVGGAGGLDQSVLDRLRPFFLNAVAQATRATQAIVVDGGTDSGVMRLMGEARAALNGGFPLLGVAAEGTIAPPHGRGERPDATSIEPHHTHLLLVPGDHWGDESPWIAETASVLAQGFGSVTLLVNGGEIALEDVTHSVSAGRPVLVLAGSGRLADTIAGALRGEASDSRIEQLILSGKLHLASVAEGPEALRKALEAHLSR